MRLILFQRGATGWGFQVGRLYWQVNYWRFMHFGHKHWSGLYRVWSIGHVGWEAS